MSVHVVTTLSNNNNSCDDNDDSNANMNTRKYVSCTGDPFKRFEHKKCKKNHQDKATKQKQHLAAITKPR